MSKLKIAIRMRAAFFAFIFVGHVSQVELALAQSTPTAATSSAPSASNKHIPIAEPIVESIAKEFDMQTPEQNKVLSEKDFILGAVLEFPTYSFYLGSPDLYGKAYVPNFSPRIGPRIIYKKIGLRAGFALPLPDKEVRRRGESEQKNFILSFYFRKFAFDFYYQNFKGFYVSNPLTEFDFHKPDRFSQLPDAFSRHWGLNWYYNVSASQFSLGSAFDQSDSELQAGESWVIIPFYRYWKINLGERIIKGSDSDSLDTLPPLRAGEFNTLGGSVAYAKTWTYKKTYLSLLGGAGPALQKQSYIEKGVDQDRLTLAGKLNLNMSIGMKPKDYMLGTTFILDTIYSQISNKEVYSTLASIEIFYSRKF